MVSERKVNHLKLGAGLLLSMLCLIAPVVFVLRLVGGLMGPPIDYSGINNDALVVGLVLLFIDTGIVSGLHCLRWFYYFALPLVPLVTMFLLPVLLPPLAKCDMQALVCGTIIVCGFVLSPLSMALLAGSVQVVCISNEGVNSEE